MVVMWGVPFTNPLEGRNDLDYKQRLRSFCESNKRVLANCPERAANTGDPCVTSHLACKAPSSMITNSYEELGFMITDVSFIQVSSELGVTFTIIQNIIPSGFQFFFWNKRLRIHNL